MAGASPERQRAEPYAPHREGREEQRRSLAVVERGAHRRRGLGPRQRPAAWLVAFAVCVALLAVGRVTLSFALVQKNMDTETLVREQRALRSENARLQEQLAGLMATPRLRELAMERFGLVPAQNVVYLEGATPAQAAAGGDTSAGGTEAAGGATGGDGGQSKVGVVDDGGR